MIAPEGFANKMQIIRNKLGAIPFYDEENMHADMDNLMCETLIQLGYEEGIKIFKDAPKWYA